MPCADPWAHSDSEDDPQGDDEGRDAVTDAEARRRNHYNAGYLDGLETGKEETIQGGFNYGFVQGGRAGFEYGQLKGAACSVKIFAGQVSGSGKWAETMKDSEEYLKGMTTVKALKAAHAESLDTSKRDLKDGLFEVKRNIETVGISLREYPEGISSTT